MSMSAFPSTITVLGHFFRACCPLPPLKWLGESVAPSEKGAERDGRVTRTLRQDGRRRAAARRGCPPALIPGAPRSPRSRGPRSIRSSRASSAVGGCGGGRGSRVSLVQYTQWGVPNTKRQGCSFEMGSTHCTNLGPAPQSPTDSHLLKVACYLLISMLILSKEPYPMVLARSSQSISLASSTLISYNL